MTIDQRAYERARQLTLAHNKLNTRALLRTFIESEFPGRIALVSSFGSEAALLLHMVAEIDRSLPVIFLDTGKLFGETLRYRDELVRRLGAEGRHERDPAAKFLLDQGSQQRRAGQSPIAIGEFGSAFAR